MMSRTYRLPSTHLTDTEVRVLTAVARGDTNAQAAHRLGKNVQAIKNSIMRKLGVQSRTTAVIAGARRGLIDVPGVTDPAGLAMLEADIEARLGAIHDETGALLDELREGR